MVKRIVTLGVVLVMMFGVFGGCNSGLWFKVGYNDEGLFGGKEGVAFGLQALVNSIDEMKDLCEEWNNPTYQEDSPNFSSELNKKIREYDEAFFADKSVVVIQFMGGNIGNGYSHKIKNIMIENEVLVVEHHAIRKKGTWQDYAVSRVFLIEVNKLDIATITEIQVQSIQK